MPGCVKEKLTGSENMGYVHRKRGGLMDLYGGAWEGIVAQKKGMSNPCPHESMTSPPKPLPDRERGGTLHSIFLTIALWDFPNK